MQDEGVDSKMSRKRLEQLALQYGIMLGDPRSKPARMVFSASSKDIEDATLAVNSVRLERFNSKKHHILHRKPTKAPFTPEELDAALEWMVENGSSTLQIKAIVDMDAAVHRPPSDKHGIVQRLRGQDQKETRTTALRTATVKRRDDVISILAATSDQTSIDEALEIAIANQDLASMSALMHTGADPNRHGDRFLEFVRTQRTELVVCMGSGKRQIDSPIVTRAISAAIQNHDTRSTRILLYHGANPNSDHGTAFAQAVKNLQIDTVTHMCLSSHPPTPESLGAAASFIGLDTQNNSTNLKLAEILLAAGLPQIHIDQALVRAADIGCLSLASLLVTNKASITHDRCRAAKTTLRTSNLELLTVLLKAHDSKAASNTLLPYTQGLRATVPVVARIAMMNSLALMRPHVETLNECMVDASRNSQLEEVKVLVLQGATADYKNGEALDLAVRQADIQVVATLCPSATKRHTRLRAIASVVKTAREHWFGMAGIILAAVPVLKGAQIDETLIYAIKQQSVSLDYDLVELLIRHADVNSSRGECFKLAAGSRGWADARLLGLLLKHGSPNPTTIGDSLLAACSLKDIDRRYAIMEALSVRDAAGGGLQAALLYAIDSTDNCVKFLNLLAVRFQADVDHDGATAVLKALDHGNLDALDVLLGRSRLTITRDIALRRAVDANNKSACAMTLAKGVSQAALDVALESRVQRDDIDHSLVELLLQHGSSIDFHSASAVQKSIETHDSVLFSILIGSQKTAIDTLDVAVAKILDLRSEDVRITFLEILVDKAQSELKDTLTAHLPWSFGSKKSTVRVLRLFLKNGADVDALHATAISRAIEIRNVDALNRLLKYAENPKTFTQALDEGHALENVTEKQTVYSTIFKQLRRSSRISHERVVISNISEALITHIQAFNPDHAIVKQFLENGADVHQQRNRSLRDAMCKCDCTILELLLDYIKDSHIPNELFSEASTNPQIWSKPAAPSILELLIQYGASGKPLESALLKAAYDYRELGHGRRIVQVLLDAGTRPSKDIFNAAARSGHPDLYQQLFEVEHNKHDIDEVVPRLLSYSHKEREVLQILEQIQEKTKGDLDINSRVSGLLPCLFQSFINGYSAAVFGKLLKMGATYEQKATIDIDERVGKEITPIMVYILQKGSVHQDTGDATIMVQLLLHGQSTESINFATPKSQLSALFIASRRANYEILKGLVSIGADVNCRWQKKSPLYMAASRGNEAMARCIIEAGAKTNDGSLHEAARCCNPKLVKMILQAGHDPNFPSPIHDRCNPLQTVVMNSVSQENDDQRLEGTIRQLVAGGAEIRSQQDGKSLLFMALDSPQAAQMAASLLGAGMGGLVNEQSNLFEQDGLIQSALGYVKRQTRYTNASATKLQLIRILESYGAVDIYYKKAGPQPSDFVNAPEDVRIREERRLDREQRRAEDLQDHKDRLARTRMEAEELQRLSDQTHQQALTQQKAQAGQQQQLTQFSHNLAIAQNAELASARDKAYRKSTTLSIEMDKKKGAAQEAIAEHRRHAESGHEQDMSRIRLEEQREANKQRRSIMSEEDRFAERHYGREMKQIQAKADVIQQQSRLTASHRELMQSQRELAQVTAGQQQKALDWSDIPD